MNTHLHAIDLQRTRFLAYVLVIAVSAPLAHAQLTLNSLTVDAGGGTAIAPGWSLHCTTGQPDAGALSGGPWTLALGYWPNAAPLPPPLCVADVDDGSGTGTPDGGVTIDDLLYYLFIFETGDIRSDVDDGSGTGATDGGVTIDDLLYYLARFEAGC